MKKKKSLEIWKYAECCAVTYLKVILRYNQQTKSRHVMSSHHINSYERLIKMSYSDNNYPYN